ANAVRDVRHALFLVAYLTLNAQRPAVADLLERLNEQLDVRLSLAERHFLAPRAGHLGPVGILYVNAADVWTKNLHRPNGIALVIEQHVSGVEVDLEVRTFQVVQRLPQQVRRLLAGLERDGNTLGLRQIADLRQRVEERLAVGVV